MSVVEMEPLKMAIFLDGDGSEIFKEDRLATEITELDSSVAHMASFLARLLFKTRRPAKSVATLP